MVRAAANAGTVLMVQWPIAWRPAFQQAVKMVREGEIGQVWQVHYRSAHAGPKEFGCTPYFYNWLYDREKNGAGALIDYCCYGAAMTRDLMGQPTRVTAMAGRYQKDYVEVDDNAVILMGYHHGLAISEASWTQVGNLTSYVPTFYGSEGTLVVQGDKLQLATHSEPNGRMIDVPEPPPETRSGTAYFLSRILKELPVEGICSAEVSRDAQEILEAGLISAATGQEVSLPLRTSLG
jgi:predicted dehydrogenase